MEYEVLSDNLSVFSSGDDLLVLSIDIGDGRKDKITVMSNSTPDQLALDFCSKHRLGAKAKILLSDEIEKNLYNVTPHLKPLPYAAHSGLSTSPGQGSFTPVNFTENTEKFSPVQKEALKIPPPSTIRKLNGCLFNNPKNKVVAKKIPEKKVSPKPLPIKSVHKKSYSTLLKPAEINNCSLSPNLFSSPQKKVKNVNSNKTASLRLSQTVKGATPVCNKSEKIVKNLKLKSYKRIFEKLNPDSSGVISSYTVQQVSSTNFKEYKLIYPIIEEMNIMKETLNFQEFYDAMEILMKFLTVSEKNSILLPEKGRPVEPPQEIKKKRGKSNGPDLYERGVLRKNDTWHKILQEKEYKDQIELQECFFHPNISGSSRRSRTSSKA